MGVNVTVDTCLDAAIAASAGESSFTIDLLLDGTPGNGFPGTVDLGTIDTGDIITKIHTVKTAGNLTPDTVDPQMKYILDTQGDLSMAYTPFQINRSVLITDQVNGIISTADGRKVQLDISVDTVQGELKIVVFYIPA